ncbi:MAG: TIR domain-containing protein, partial [Lysobacter sp.]
RGSPMRFGAFLSYSHADAAWARWLLRRLETYRVPARLVGTHGAYGEIGRRLGTCFRDRDELPSAGDLGATIREALADSATLIVICSPAAAQSRWVNAEVEAFQASGRGERVLCFVVAGVPGSADPAQQCFPPALLRPGADGAPCEPLAADARPTGDGRERAFLKLVAGLLGVGFDALAQREAQRRNRKLTLIAAASVAGMTLALVLAATAVVARNDAQRRQAQAEDILGFMLGDLRKKLTTVGRLDLMGAVDNKATAYFASLDPRDLTDRALEEQARSLTGIGQVRLEEGKHDAAMAAFREAHARSTALRERAPGNGQRLFDLAQAEYWIGFVAWQQGRLDDAGVWLRKYRDSAIALAAMDPGNFDWQREVAYGHYNSAVLDESRGRYAEAERAMRAQIPLYRAWLKERPQDLELRFEAANVASWLGSLALRQGRLADAENFFVEQADAMRRSVAEDARNARWKEVRIESLLLLADAQAQRGRLAASRASVEVALPLAAALSAQDPANNPWRISLGKCRWWQAQLDAARATSSSGAAADDAALLLAAGHAAEPENERTLIWLVRARNLQAQLALARGDIAVARAHLSEARRLIEPAWQAEQNETLRLWLAKTRLLEGEAAQLGRNPTEAGAAWTEARQLLLADTAPSVPFGRLDPLVRVMRHLDQIAEAAPHLQRLDAASYMPLRPWPATTTAVATR